MANRLQRDQLLIRALDLVDSPRLDEKDRPAGTIVAGALSLGWLQDALDLAINLFPFQGTLKTATVTFTRGTPTYAISGIATDYVQDFKDGVVLSADKGRLHRKALNKLLDVNVSASAYGKPQWYVIHNNLLVARPIPDATYTATLYYYSLPAILVGTDIPNFPADMLLVEFVHLRGKEWTREVPSGTAEAYLMAACARLQKAGLGPEAEIDDQIGVDRDYFPGGGSWGQDPEWFTRVQA